MSHKSYASASNFAPVELLNARTGALWAAGRGLRVFRVAANKKTPATEEGVKEATTDTATIERWFDQNPKLNYGIAMGGPGKLVALDVDVKHDSEAAIAEYLGIEHPATLEFISCSGGMHVVLCTDFDAGQRDLAGAKHVNVRAQGGYLVGPGSVVDGKRYRLAKDLPIAACPEHIAKRISRRGERPEGPPAALVTPDEPVALRDGWGLVEATEGVAESVDGGRNTAAHKLAGLIKRKGVSEDSCAEMVARWAEKCSPPLEEEEARKAVASSYRNGDWPIGLDAGEFEDISAAVAEAQAKPASRKLLEFPSDIRLEDLVRRQSNALVKGVLHPGDAAVLYGESTAGKSFVALDMAWHVATGRPWHGRKVIKGPVLYVALEGVDGFRKRMLAAMQALGDAGEHLARLCLHVSLVKGEAGKEGVKTILEAVQALAAKAGQPVALIIIDTYARATAGDDENAGDAVMNFVERRAGVISRATAAAVMTVAHTNRSGDMRGSLHLRNSADVVLKVERQDRDRRLVGEKVKDGEEGTLFDFTLQPVELARDEDGEPVTSCRIVSTPPKPSAIGQREPTTSRVFRAAYQAVSAEQQRSDVLLADVRDEFTKRYTSRGERDPKKLAAAKRNAWHTVTRNLPKGLELVDQGGTERVRAVGSTSPNDEFEPIEAAALEALDSSRT